jgi:hypothetical protein
MKKILFVGPNSYVLRNWLATGLADLCQDRLELEPVFVSPFGEPTLPSAKGRSFENHMMAMETIRGTEVPQGYSRLLFSIGYLRLRTFAQELENGSLQMMTLARKRDMSHYLLRAARTLMPRGSSRRAWARRAVDSINPSYPPAGELLDKVRPECVVVGTPGVNYLDQVLMIEASRRGIPVHCVVNSWDNLTSRGSMIRRPDTLMVWNRHMKQHATEIHGYPEQRTFCVGALQFAPYDEPLQSAEVHALYKRLNLPHGSPYVLFLSGQHLPEYEAEDLAMLLRALEKTAYADMPVVARMHPQAVVEPFAALKHPRLVLDIPPRFASGGNGGARFGQAEVRTMATLLSNSTAVFASWGTTALLEAAIFGRPAVQLRWMDAVPHSIPEQAARIRDLQRYEHLKPFDAAGSRLFSDHPDDLAATLDACMRDEAEHRKRCEQALSDLTTLPLAGAPERVVAVLAQNAVHRSRRPRSRVAAL